mmetsp:Transcript_29983/g.90765  ORF Transcript_29983/g.90765 Transcript_29983/m.90765 type:complete len:228 (+) Transcript_29983:353-1036(+)
MGRSTSFWAAGSTTPSKGTWCIATRSSSLGQHLTLGKRAWASPTTLSTSSTSRKRVRRRIGGLRWPPGSSTGTGTATRTSSSGRTPACATTSGSPRRRSCTAGAGPTPSRGSAAIWGGMPATSSASTRFQDPLRPAARSCPRPRPSSIGTRTVTSTSSSRRRARDHRAPCDISSGWARPLSSGKGTTTRCVGSEASTRSSSTRIRTATRTSLWRGAGVASTSTRCKR